MTVSWSFLGGGGSGSAIWGSLGGGLSGISSGGLSLSIGSGTDTFGGVFSLSNTSGFALQSLTLAGASGRTIFDCAWDGSICVAGNANADQGTVGSANGWTLQTNGGTFGGTVSAVYSNLVGIGINPPVGDLFEQLVLSFGANGLASGLTYSFIADTDNSPFDQPPPTSSTPEPSTFVLAGIGLIGLGTLGRRRGRA
jgi:hypothetical protein